MNAGYVVVDNVLFSEHGINVVMRNRIKDVGGVETHQFDTSGPQVQAEISKHTKQQARYPAQVEII